MNDVSSEVCGVLERSIVVCNNVAGATSVHPAHAYETETETSKTKELEHDICIVDKCLIVGSCGSLLHGSNLICLQPYGLISGCTPNSSKHHRQSPSIRTSSLHHYIHLPPVTKYISRYSI